MPKHKSYYICDRCSAHSPFPFRRCPSCSNESIRQEGLWEGYFQNEFIPILKIFLEARELYCPYCFPNYSRLNLVQTKKNQFGYPYQFFTCNICAYGIRIDKLFNIANIIYDPSYRNNNKEVLISIQEIGGKKLVIGKKI